MTPEEIALEKSADHAALVRLIERALRRKGVRATDCPPMSWLEIVLYNNNQLELDDELASREELDAALTEVVKKAEEKKP